LSAANLSDKVESNIYIAYDAIHRLGVIHGDVRKENVLILEDESVRIVDFENSSVVAENDEMKLSQLDVTEVTLMLSALKSTPSCSNPV
jgi:RIO-like serine/threonine protein kinase